MSSSPLDRQDARSIVLSEFKSEEEVLRAIEIAEKTGLKSNTVSVALRKLVNEGVLTQVAHGRYSKSSPKPEPSLSQNSALHFDHHEPAGFDANTRLVAYPISGGAVGASWEVGLSWDEGEVMSMPRALIVSMVGFFPDPSETRWVNVKGDSMEPFLSDGTPVLVQRVRRVSESGRYVLWYGEDVEMVKRIEVLGLGHLRISCDNLAYPSREYIYIGDSIWEEVLDTDDNGTPRRKRTVRFEITARVIYPKDTSPAIVRMQNKG